jgi:hypothetical protein
VLRRLTLGVILLLAGVPSASADLVLQADPPSATTSGGVTTTTINIRLDNATDLASYNVEFALELPGIDFSGLSITQPNPPGVTITIAAATTNAIFPLTGNFFAQLNYAPGDPTNVGRVTLSDFLLSGSVTTSSSNDVLGVVMIQSSAAVTPTETFIADSLQLSNPGGNPISGFAELQASLEPTAVVPEPSMMLPALFGSGILAGHLVLERRRLARRRIDP